MVYIEWITSKLTLELSPHVRRASTLVLYSVMVWTLVLILYFWTWNWCQQCTRIQCQQKSFAYDFMVISLFPFRWHSRKRKKSLTSLHVPQRWPIITNIHVQSSTHAHFNLWKYLNDCPNRNYWTILRTLGFLSRGSTSEEALESLKSSHFPEQKIQKMNFMWKKRPYLLICSKWTMAYGRASKSLQWNSTVSRMNPVPFLFLFTVCNTFSKRPPVQSLCKMCPKKIK